MSGLTSVPEGFLSEEGGGKTGGIERGCGLWHLQAEVPGLLQAAEPSGPTLEWNQYQLQA